MLTGALETIYTEEIKLYIEVTEPCLVAGIINANAITAIEYWIGDGVQSQQLGAGFWDDTPSTTYATPDYCGVKNVELVEAD